MKFERLYRRGFGICGVLAALAGCASHPATGIPVAAPATAQAATSPAVVARDLAVLEVALRAELKDVAPGTTAFLSVGVFAGEWKDPPPILLSKLADLRIRLKPASGARLPKLGERESAHRYRGVEDPETGARTPIYWAEIKEWVSDAKVVVEVGMYSGPLGSGATRNVYVLKDGKWEFSSAGVGWVS